MVPERWPIRPRTLSGAWRAIEDMRIRIDSMQIADEVAEKVKKELDAHRLYRFTVLQKIGAVAIAAVTTADLILSLVHLK